MKNRTDPSIRTQLLSSLLVPLGILWFIGAAAAYYLAAGFADSNYDHQLLNSADSVVARLKSDGKKILVDLPPAAQAILRHNDTDKFYYQILRKDGTRISGDAVIPGPFHNLDSREPVLRYAQMNGHPVRIARVPVDVANYPDQTVLVQVAETLNSRSQLTHQILLSILVPQMILIAIGALAVSRGVAKGMAPLKDLEQALADRSPSDWSPVPAADTPIEVRPLVLEINNLLTRLSEEIESQKRFVANAAHQFRTPLAALKTYIYAAQKLPASKPMSDVLNKIDVGTERMSHLSRKLLALAKAEPPNRDQNYTNIDLNFIASEVTAGFSGEADRRNLELRFIGSNHQALVLGDAHNLSELTANLVENAVLYSTPGTQVSVTVANGDGISLIVQDTGPGIPVNERARVFERFYRVLGSQSPGSGLGLSIVKEIADAHCATVSICDSPGGQGATVTIHFRAHDSN